MKRKNNVKWLAGLVIFAISALLSHLVPVSHAQFIDRIVRPCATGNARGTVQVTTTDILINPCPGGQATINGVPIIASGGGNVTGPVSSTDNAITRFNLTTGQLVQNSLAILDDNGNITTPGSITTGSGGGANGALDLSGLTSGTVSVTVANAAGTWALTLPVTAGSSGQFLQTNGSGVTTWAAATSAPGGANTQVQFNDSGVFGGDAGLTYVKATDSLAVAGELTVAKAARTGTASNTDYAGKLTVGAGGTITYTFTQTYLTAPICVSSDTDAVPLITGASASTTVLTVTGNVGHVVNYQCIGLN